MIPVAPFKREHSAIRFVYSTTNVTRGNYCQLHNDHFDDVLMKGCVGSHGLTGKWPAKFSCATVFALEFKLGERKVTV